ncbi:MAG: aminoacyl-tRNA hydrolase [Alphaproteobacteria bacterium]
MKLIVGLGNPGTQYLNTRHNVGFMALDEICKCHSFCDYKKKFNGLVAEGNIDGVKTLLLKPQTFMNLSGNSVLAAASFYKIKPEDIVVIHDDLDIVLGKVKAKIGGGSAGHNGLKSIDSNLGNQYYRIRIGIGNDKAQVINHVLGNFNKTENETLSVIFDRIANNINLLLNADLNKFASIIGEK